jgi:transcriptional regulator with GAF, ATPase, and Fis domain
MNETRTLARSRGPEAPVVGSYVIRVVSGPDTGLAIAVDGSQPSRILVGQSPACGLRLQDPHVSRRHLALEATDRGIHILDLGSYNGTWYRGCAIKDAYFGDGQVIEVGSSALQVELAGEPRAIPLSTATSFGRVFGASPSMRRIYPLCERLAQSDVPLVIEGETGTGKEFLAEAIHEQSKRAEAPFVVFDCTTVAANLVESALFGHERGAFTSAVGTRKGVFELAQGGTLLIDEIGDLDPSLQPKLLRALERLEIQRVGGDRWIPLDVRVMAATRRDLDREVQEGRFRDDLYFRLAVTRLEVPPLRDRVGDVALLARHFWRKMSPDGDEIPERVLARFETQAWPGNVRELRNAVARAVALGDLVDSAPVSLPTPSQPPPPMDSPADVIENVLREGLSLAVARQKVIDAFEGRYVASVLQRHNGNVTRAAHASGIARRYFYTLKNRLKR